MVGMVAPANSYGLIGAVITDISIRYDDYDKMDVVRDMEIIKDGITYTLTSVSMDCERSEFIIERVNKHGNDTIRN